MEVAGPTNVERTAPTSRIDDLAASMDDVKRIEWIINMALAAQIIPSECNVELSNLPNMATQKDFMQLENELNEVMEIDETNFEVTERGKPIPFNEPEQLQSSSTASLIPDEVNL